MSITNKNYEDLFFSDDFMFCKIMSQNESICRRVIKTLLGIEVGKLAYLNNQQEMRPGYFAHGIRLDVVAKDTGKVYDIEIQTSVNENLPKRARYYQAVMDVDSLNRGGEYSNLPNSYVVFICMEDPFGGKLPRYTVKDCCVENPALDEKVGDKTLKVYYNVNEWRKLAENDAEIRAFLQFLETRQPKSLLTEEIMEEVMYARGNEPWRIEFMQMRELKREGYKEGMEQGRADQLAADQAEIMQRDSKIAADQARIAELEARIAAMQSELELFKAR